MPSLTHNTPALRFPGYTGVWEQQRFNELALVRRGLTYKPSDVHASGIRVLRSSNIVEETFTTSPDDIFVQDSAINIPFIQNGDILVTAANGSSRLVGKHAIVRNLLKNSAVPGGFMLCLSSPEPDFLNASMSSSWYSKFIHVFVAGGNGSIGNISKSSLDMQPVLVPSLPEQRKIGSFFRHVDGLINLHQRQTQKLTELKQGLLQDMFPREGESVPRLRFPGFTDTWEQHQLNDYCGQLSATLDPQKTPNSIFAEYSMPAFDNGEIPNIVTGNTMNSTRKILDRSCLLINKLNVRKKRIWLVDKPEDNAVSSAEFIPIYSDEISLKFLKYSVSNETFTTYLEECSSGSSNSQKRITPDVLMSAKLSFPSRREQDAIGQLMTVLDDLLALHEQYTMKLTHLKKGLLQKMFPQD